LTRAVPPDLTPVPEIICEGDTDRTVYEVLAGKGILQRIEAYPKRGEEGGLARQPGRIKALVHIGRERLVVARDLDDAPDGPALLRRLASDLGSEATVVSDQTPLLLQMRDCRIALVPQGLPGTPLLRKHLVDKYAIDDYLLVLLEQSVGKPPALFEDANDRDRAFAKMDEVRRLMAGQGYPVSTSKRLVFLLKAIKDFGVAPATLAGQTIAAAPVEVVQRVFQPLIETVNAAVQALA